MPYKAMITVPVKECNHFSQEFYDEVIAGIQLHMVECTCGKKGCLIRYGHYRRVVKFRGQKVLLSVQRVLCKACHKTHAILLSVIVPYSQIPLEDQQGILAAVDSRESPEPIMERNPLVDENNVKYIIRQYKHHWEQRLRYLGLTLIDKLAVPCLQAFSRQFMQIQRTRNKLCTYTNTA